MSSNRWLPYALITPAVLFLGLFFIAPLVQTITLSFNGGGTPDVLANYKRMANDLNFGVSIRNTFLLVLAVIPIQLALALAMGMMLQKMERGRDIVLWIWTIPLGVSDLAAGLAWLSIMQNTGYLNTVLFSLGLVDGPTAWLNSESPATLFIAVVLTEVWRSTAVVLVVLVAGLQLIPKEFGEAAEIFGASPWTKFRKVTLPLLKPSIQSALDPADRARLRGLRGGVRPGRTQLPGPRGRGLCLAEREPELWRRCCLCGPRDDHLAGRHARLSLRPAHQAGGPVMSGNQHDRRIRMTGNRRLLFWSGAVALCAWVLVPIYLIGLGAFGGRAAAFKWPKDSGPPTPLCGHSSHSCASRACGTPR